MTDQPSPEFEREPDAETPRWVKTFVIIGGIVILLLLGVLLFGGGQHGPGRHVSSGGEPVSQGRS
jgi:hypothetical protein